MDDNIKKGLEESLGIRLPKGEFRSEGKYVFLFTGKPLPLKGTFGLHIGSMERESIRPTIDACQLATRNFVDVGEDEAVRWMCGLDLEREAKGDYVAVRFGRYILGPGKPRGGRILNSTPKNRRLPLSRLTKTKS